jgi:uncharacterized membrane protein
MHRFDRFGAKLGVLLCLAGFVVIFLGWNGAASVDRVTAQFPYFISGGIAGLALVILGAILISVDSRREDSSRVEQMLVEVRDALARMAPPPEEEALDTGAGPMVVTGQTSFHRPDCRLLEGREGLIEMSIEAALARDLIPCRICEPTPAPPASSPRRSRASSRRPRTPRGKVGPR